MVLVIVVSTDINAEPAKRLVLRYLWGQLISAAAADPAVEQLQLDFLRAARK